MLLRVWATQVDPGREAEYLAYARTHARAMRWHPNRQACAPPPRTLMICRLWHGWTTRANADAYDQLLRDEVFRGIAGRAIAGYRGIELLRREAGDEVEFVTLMWFDSFDAVRAFAGAAYEAAVVPAAARALLSRFDAQSTHFEVRVPRRPL